MEGILEQNEAVALHVAKEHSLAAAENALVDILQILLMRVTYVFVPIYHKNIVNCLTTLSPD